jgi:chaperone required for assembly of F1-ATPase
MTSFSDIFGINFTLNQNILLNSKTTISSKFKDYLKKLNNSEITILYKLSNLTNSIILSFFFMKKKISCKRLFKLVNIEYNYQQKRWGVLKEHKLNNVFLENALANIDYFLKNMS